MTVWHLATLFVYAQDFHVLRASCYEYFPSETTNLRKTMMLTTRGNNMAFRRLVSDVIFSRSSYPTLFKSPSNPRLPSVLEIYQLFRTVCSSILSGILP